MPLQMVQRQVMQALVLALFPLHQCMRHFSNFHLPQPRLQPQTLVCFEPHIPTLEPATGREMRMNSYWHAQILELKSCHCFCLSEMRQKFGTVAQSLSTLLASITHHRNTTSISISSSCKTSMETMQWHIRSTMDLRVGLLWTLLHCSRLFQRMKQPSFNLPVCSPRRTLHLRLKVCDFHHLSLNQDVLPTNHQEAAAAAELLFQVSSWRSFQGCKLISSRGETSENLKPQKSKHRRSLNLFLYMYTTGNLLKSCSCTNKPNCQLV